MFGGKIFKVQKSIEAKQKEKGHGLSEYFF
jgi:hypothetical protein